MTTKVVGTCPACHQTVRLRKDRRVGMHLPYGGGGVCRGVGLSPELKTIMQVRDMMAQGIGVVGGISGGLPGETDEEKARGDIAAMRAVVEHLKGRKKK